MQLSIGFRSVVDGRVDHIVDGLALTHPTILVGVPRIFEKVRAAVMTMYPQNGVKGRISRWAFKVGRESRPYRLAGRPLPRVLRLQYAVADKLVFSKLKARLGGRMRFMISGSAKLSRQVQEWFYSADITIVEGFGATETVNYGKHDLREQVMTVTGGDGVDVLFDPVGGALFEQARRCLAWNGRYLVIGFAAGGIPVMPANYALIKSISMIGVAFGMSAVRDPQMNHANFATLFGWYRQGRLPVAPSSIIAFDEIPDACAQMYSGGGVGKTVVRVER